VTDYVPFGRNRGLLELRRAGGANPKLPSAGSTNGIAFQVVPASRRDLAPIPSATLPTVNPGAKTIVPSLLLLALASAGCPDGSANVTAPAFDAERAWKGLLHQVELGPRPAGTPENERCRAWIESELSGIGLAPQRETFRDMTPAGELEMANVWAELPGTDPAAGWIFIGSHFDTKRMPFRFVGANDGASSTAVVIEIARVLAQGPKRAMSYRFVFFDGEEAVRQEWIGEDNTYGSRHHVKVLQKNGRIESLRALVLLDLVGDKDLKLTNDTLSDRRFQEIFAKAARDIGLGRHVGGKSMEVRDDHVPFLLARVRCVNLIDFEYGPNNTYWHTDKDVVENCSKESLDAIGKITLRGLADLEASLKSR